MVMVIVVGGSDGLGDGVALSVGAELAGGVAAVGVGDELAPQAAKPASMHTTRMAESNFIFHFIANSSNKIKYCISPAV